MRTISSQMQASLMAEVNETHGKMAGYTNIVSSMSTRETFDILMGYGEDSEESRRCRDIFEPGGELNTDTYDGVGRLMSVFNRSISENGLGRVGMFYDYGREKERVASYFGDMAKRLDAAHSEGKFTDEEYEGLNKMIMEQLDRNIGNIEKDRARAEIRREEERKMMTEPEQYKAEQKRKSRMTDLERWEERKNMIAAFVSRFDKDFRSNLSELFNAARYGKK